MKHFFIILLIPIFIFSKEKKNQENLPNVVLVTTGGTIAEKTDPKTGGSVPTLTGNDLVEEIPTLKKIANIDVVNFSNIDSSQMTLEIWKKLAKKVDELLKDDKYIGAVITHGTDTMAVGAYFLDLTLSTNKPVVFTGSMKDASDPCSDGIDNIINATIQVCSTEANSFSVTVNIDLDYQCLKG